MIAADLAGDVVIPAAVALIGAFLAGLSAVMKTYFENRDARRATERQLDLAMKRTEFVEKWIAVSRGFGEQPKARRKAIAELNEAYDDAQMAIQQSRAQENSVVRQLRFLLMLQQRESLAPYVVSGIFLFTSVAVWMLLCIPEPGVEFSPAAAIPSAVFITLFLRVLFEVIVRGLEGLSRWRTRRREGRRPVASSSPGSVPIGTGAVAVSGQLRALAMIQPRRNRASYVNRVSYGVSALFVVGVSASALFLFEDAIRADDPLASVPCAAPYYGGYFGDVPPPDDVEVASIYEPAEGPADFYDDDPHDPLFGVGGEGETVIFYKDFDQVTYFSWGDSEVDGDVDGDVYLWDHARLTERSGKPLGKGCEPVQVKVAVAEGDDVSEVAADGWLLYGYFDEDKGYQQVEFYQGVADSTTLDSITLEGYFGTDWRFMPACSAERPSMYTCIDPGDVYYDSGAYRLVSRLVIAGFWIIGIALAARLVAGLLVFGLEQFSTRRARSRPSERAAEGV